MSEQEKGPKGPNLSEGVSESLLQENKPLVGRVGTDQVMVVRTKTGLYAVGSVCTHYGGPLAEGLVEGDSVHCPWHHACFDLRSGAPKSPGLDDIPCFEVTQADGLVKVGRRQTIPKPKPTKNAPESIVIVGAGPAGTACVEELRRCGYEGPITIIGDEAPVDRPNLSKDFLAGNAPAEWLPLREPDFFKAHDVELVVGDKATRIDRAGREVHLASGRKVSYGALLLATGSEPIKLPIEGMGLPHVRLLRTLDDSRAIIKAAEGVPRAVVLGAGFIGLEVAASLRTRGLEVDVVAPDSMPLVNALGVELGRFVKGIHEAKGVRFHLELRASKITENEVVLENGTSIPAQLVVVGVGVRPRTQLASDAGLEVDHGVVVNERLETSDARIFAAGDIARYPDPRTNEPARVEHWVHAGRTGQAAARAMLGNKEPFTDPPFFWSAHYDQVVCRVGSGGSFDRVEVHGDLKKGDAIAAYRRNGRIVAVATVGRNKDSLRADVALRQGDDATLEKLLV